MNWIARLFGEPDSMPAPGPMSCLKLTDLCDCDRVPGWFAEIYFGHLVTAPLLPPDSDEIPTPADTYRKLWRVDIERTGDDRP